MLTSIKIFDGTEATAGPAKLNTSIAAVCSSFARQLSYNLHTTIRICVITSISYTPLYGRGQFLFTILVATCPCIWNQVSSSRSRSRSFIGINVCMTQQLTRCNGLARPRSNPYATWLSPVVRTSETEPVVKRHSEATKCALFVTTM